MSSADELEFHDAIDAEETLTRVEHIVDNIIKEALFNEGPSEVEEAIEEPFLGETNAGGTNTKAGTKSANERFEEQRSKFVKRLDEQEIEAVIGNIESAVESAVEEALTGPVLTEESESEFETRRTEFITKLEWEKRDEIVKNIEWAVANVIDEALVGEECSDNGREYDESGVDTNGEDASSGDTVDRGTGDKDTSDIDTSDGNLKDKKSNDRKLDSSNQERSKSGNADHEHPRSENEDQEPLKSRNADQEPPQLRNTDQGPIKSGTANQEHSKSREDRQEPPKSKEGNQEHPKSGNANQEHSKPKDTEQDPQKSKEDNQERTEPRKNDQKLPKPKPKGNEQEPAKSSSTEQKHPQSRNADQERTKSRNDSQEHLKSNSNNQKPSKSGEKDHKPSESSDTEKKHSESSENDQDHTKSSGNNQEPPKSRERDQKLPKSSVTEQELPKSSVTEQKLPKSSNTEQELPKFSVTEQEHLKSSETEQKLQNSNSKDEESPKSSGTEQERSKPGSSTDADRIRILDKLSAAASASTTSTNSNTSGSPAPAQNGSYLGSWGGMFSALTGIGSTVSTQVDKVYDALDPNLPETEEDPRSIKTLLDKLSPTNTNDGETGGSWLSGFDKTFDFASDKIGQALIGGIKKLESTVGVTIEPMSSSSSVNEIVYDVDNPEGSSASSPSGTSGANGAEGPSPVSQVSQFGKNIYSAGMSTLGKLGRTTADIVVSTKDRITPLLEKDNKIDRSELKKPFAVLFDEFCGNDALEKLQIRSTQAAIQLKSKLKALNPQQLKKVQGELKGVGALLDNIEASEAALEWPDLFSAEEAEMVVKLQDSFTHSLKKMENVDESLADLRENVDTPLPPDMPSLLVYLGRFHMAKMLSAALHLTLLLTKPDEKEIHRLATVLRGKIESITRVEEVAELDSNRRKAALQLLATDVSQAQTTLRDALLTLQPQLRLARLQ